MGKLNKQYVELVKIIKKKRTLQELPARYEDIAKIMGYDRSYFSSLMGGRYPITQNHIKLLKLNFPFLDDAKPERDLYEVLISIEKKLDILIKRK